MSRSARVGIVNAITFARVPLILAWAVLAVWQEFTGSIVLLVLASLAMLFAGLTDLWDGKLARRWGVVSTLGKMADPLMDKAFYIVAFPTLSWQILHQEILHQGGNEFHALAMLSFTILYMLRDTWVTFLRAVGAAFGADVAAMWLGKVRTAASFPGAGWVYSFLVFRRFAPESWQTPWLWSCYAVEAFLAALTLWSFWTYTIAYLPSLKMALARK